MQKNRYAAKLLFQFRVSDSNEKRRLCEERIVLLESTSPKRALQTAKTIGKKEQFNYQNKTGGTVYFEFVGIQDLVELFDPSDCNEVWYDIKRYMLPMERKSKVTKSDADLLKRT